jgi:prepilin-type N-terminal cleavage/methylation domain-containing protein
MTAISQKTAPVPAPRRRGSSRRGFTLTEALLATVIVGVGVLSSLNLFWSCTEASSKAGQTTTGRTLAENIREAMASVTFYDPVSAGTMWGPEPGEILSSYDDVDDFDGADFKGTSFNPPIDAMKQPIPALMQYTQLVTVMPVNPDDPGSNENESAPTLPKGAYTGAVRVRVRVYFQQSPASPKCEVFQASWLRVNN